MSSKVNPELDAREELANALTHGLGAVASAIGGVVLVVLAAIHAGLLEALTAAVFAVSLVVLYLASTLYHSARHPLVRYRLKILDHCAIFLLIAGTYTPFTLVGLGGAWGWSLFGVIWSLAALGIVLKLFFTGRFRLLSTATYVVMGWLAIIAFVPMTQQLHPAALTWLIIGGVTYTAGTIFYHNHRIPYAHAVWHLFVLGGSVCHFAAVSLQFFATG
ncbi:PAQR family membrane homeostasis protein TrhA [Natronospira bacteriovora]|uniref:Hemolysin III family protein n=1 Tax=Natronospira bacteriovora TaxID=3069753 RepID=A0ABU0W5N9_9GAMM|nr:hemolysin III family protein [Natronospira sp. AB-CW4]MDQ2069348.1 hemolysin III family protein [Natronospira sp. AB-CW4]